MPPIGTLILTISAVLAFANKSLLCHMALKHTNIDAASFTSIRLLSGALMLWLIVRLPGEMIARVGSWFASLVLIAYAACFAIAYVNLSPGTVALLLFGSIQIIMISYGLCIEERLRGYAIAAGAIASGMGYAIWYHALPGLQVTHAAVVQLSVPMLAVIAVLGGIALVIRQRHTPQRSRQIPSNASEFIRKQRRDCRFLTLSLPVRQRLIWSLWLMTWLGLLAGLISRQW
ncbi:MULTISPECIES: hypothetical protein [unclassified Nostoc]|uniref:hypothetical protein n=1 Tax=unclassified Nostoc TaxID=2593658 RepID=UPI0018EF6A02|nr:MULTISPECIES: hypothetical protein [unclassified Nostoc]